MTLGDFFPGGFLVQSIGVVGLVFGRKTTTQEPPQDKELGNPTTAIDSPPTYSRREEIRREHRVRLISTDEEGLAAAGLPDGVYGFTYAPLSETPLFRRHAYHSFECHKTAGGAGYVLAYVSAAEAAQIRARERDVKVKLYPDTWEAATELVAIPIARLTSKKMNPSREPGNWLEATFQPE